MKKQFLLLALAFVMTALTQSVWAIESHFYLIGSFTGDNWNENREDYPINANYENGTSKYCIEVDVKDGNTYYFALWNKDNRYAPLGDKTGENSYGENKELNITSLANYNGEAVCASQGKGSDAWYNDGDKQDKPNVSNNSWKITANYTGKLLICIDEDWDQEWYPYVWLERPKYYLIGGVLSGENLWGANNVSLPIVEKYNDDGKYYANLYLKKDTYFALSRGGKRFAPANSTDVTINTSYNGGCNNGQDNSWKYAGESGLVRLVMDVKAETFTLEPWQMYLIGSVVDGDQWSVSNTSKPLNNAYFNLEGNDEEGKAYYDVQLNQNEGYLAFSDGLHRYANNTNEQNKDIDAGQDGQQGTYDKPDNSWKFVGESGYVRVCIDYNTAHKPYIWLERCYKIHTGAIKGHEYGEVMVTCKGDKPAKDSLFRAGSELTFTATANAGFYPAAWYWDEEGTNVAVNENDSWNGIFQDQSEDAKAYAKFLPRYDVVGSENAPGDPQNGMPGWGWSETGPAISDYKLAIDENSYSKTYVLSANTTYKFKLYDYYEGHYVGVDGEEAPAVNIGTEILFSTKENKDVLFQTSQAGKYTFKIVYSATEPAKVTISYDGLTTPIEQTSVINDNIVYDIMGRVLGTSVENLPQGIYVRNGKKFVVAQ